MLTKPMRVGWDCLIRQAKFARLNVGDMWLGRNTKVVGQIDSRRRTAYAVTAPPSKRQYSQPSRCNRSRIIGFLYSLRHFNLSAGGFDMTPVVKSRSRKTLLRPDSFTATTDRMLCEASGQAAWPFEMPPPPVASFPQVLPSGRRWPRISVITPTYNQGRFIEQTILSVRNQGYPNQEHIIIDGGSTDKTLEVLNHYRDDLAFVVSEPDRGQSHAINKGMAVATGEILTWLNSDDMLAPGAMFAIAMGFYTGNTDMLAGICEVYRDGRLVDRHLTSCRDGTLPLDDLLDLENAWLQGHFFYQPEVSFTRDLWEKAGGRVDESLFYSMDYELWLRFAEVGAKLGVIGRPIALFRSHAAQKTAIPEHYSAELQAFREAHLIRTGRVLDRRGPTPDRGRRLKVVFINDIGNVGGAGIAHDRFATSFQRAGQEVTRLALTDRPLAKDMRLGLTPDDIAAAVNRADADLVIVGNIHGARTGPQWMEKLGQQAQVAILLHDFWWLTGRCAYVGSCDQYKVECTSNCPTPNEYPELPKEEIHDAWKAKHLIFQKVRPSFLTCSSWATQLAEEWTNLLPQFMKYAVKEVRPGVPLEIFFPRDKQAARRALDLPADAFIILISANNLIDPRKGVPDLIESLAALSIPKLRLLMIGHDPLRQHELRGIPATYLGYILEPERLALVYSCADIFVAPSKVETFGQVFAEAAACGTPVIGYPISGVLTAIVDGVTGRHTATCDALGLTQRIFELYHDRVQRQNLSAWGRIFVENEWSLEASYRHFFVALQALGTIDRCKIPRKISFTLKSSHSPWTVLDSARTEQRTIVTALKHARRATTWIKKYGTKVFRPIWHDPVRVMYWAKNQMVKRIRKIQRKQVFNFAVVSLEDYFHAYGGFADKESWGRWTDGKLAWLVLKQPISGRIKITVRFSHIFLSNFGHDLCMLIGTARRSIPLSTRTRRVIMHVDLHAPINKVYIHIPRPESPRERGISTDSRQLGVCIRSIEIQNR